MVREDGYVKLLDFGLALDAGPSRAGRPQLAGTLRYLALERCFGQPPTQAGDIFAFGVILYELTTGRYPYESQSTLGLLQAITEQQPPRPATFRPDLPAALDHLIPAMLARTAAERPTARQVADTLAKAAQQTPKRSMSIWLAFAGVIALVTLLAVVYWLRRPPVSEAVQLPARPITSYPGDEIGTAFSPDGTRIAFAWRRETDKRYYRVYTRALDGGEPTPLTTGESHHPAWSPSGKEIAFLGAVGGRDSIFVVPAEGGVPRELVCTNTGHFNLWPDLAWSADSKWIAYSGEDNDNGARSIYVINRETRVLRKLTQPKDGEKHMEPAFSNDGNLLAFTVDRNGIGTISVVKFKDAMLPGGETQQLRFPQLEKAICSNPVWHPGNGELLFTASNGASLKWLWSVKVDTNGRATSCDSLGIWAMEPG